MRKDLRIKLPAGSGFHTRALEKACAEVLKVPLNTISHVRLCRLSLDARPKIPCYEALVEVYTAPDRYEEPAYHFEMKKAAASKKQAGVIVVGMGPAGLFAALALCHAGVKVTLLERGKKVDERAKDVGALCRDGRLNIESNYAYGEGGAGCFSDGKLYTRSNKRGDIGRVMRTFVHYGADPAILYQAHPHLGSDRMPAIVRRMREALLAAGAEIRFSTCVKEILTDRKGHFAAVVDRNGVEYKGDALFLATGNSADDLYRYLHGKGMALQEKPFAMGVRIEHPQEAINAMQYKGAEKRYALPPAEYSFVEQSGGLGVFSFCMCPGGVVIPAATQEDGLVVNGMSGSGRRSPWANAGWVAGVDRAILRQNGIRLPEHPLALLDFQQRTEKSFFTPGRGFAAPAQRLTDFLKERTSASLPRSSYSPGVFSADMREYLPGFIAEALHDVLGRISQKKKGFLTQEALLLGLESRTSSPVRILRHEENLQHPQMAGLYPCGEGAGYAGGITSSALDGLNCAESYLRDRGLDCNFAL
ncbi:FAD-binding protein [bacterium]|nr:FAD-binding protein [bacterium]